jgi:hypothetical protein
MKTYAIYDMRKGFLQDYIIIDSVKSSRSAIDKYLKDENIKVTRKIKKIKGYATFEVIPIELCNGHKQAIGRKTWYVII